MLSTEWRDMRQDEVDLWCFGAALGKAQTNKIFSFVTRCAHVKL